MDDVVVLDGASLTVKDVEHIARHGTPVTLDETARDGVTIARERVETLLASDEAVYGVTTGFGRLVDQRIDEVDRRRLQENLLRSHAVGIGEPVPTEVVRAMLVTRANALAKGFSGVRPVIIDHLIAMLNAGVHPIVPPRGSLGASGDLAPLAHLSLVLIGEGEAIVDGERVDGATALERIDREPLRLEAKEGIALINGTQLTLAMAALFCIDAKRVLDAADAAGALTSEVTMATTANCDPSIAAVRPHHGHAATAMNVRRLVTDSMVLTAHDECDRVQDVYSIRCIPQVHGTARDAVSHLWRVVDTELNAATDNPLVFRRSAIDDRAPGAVDAAVLSGGNFHGAPLAGVLEYAQGALATLATISERRIDRIVNPAVQEEHLPPFLAEDPGLESGHMLVQYASAALGNQARSRGRPSLDNAVVSGNQEDHVSMSVESALAARETLGAVRLAIAAELLVATEATRYLPGDLTLGVGTEAVADTVRGEVPPLEGDRPLAGDLETVDELIATGTIEDAIVETLGDELAMQVTPPPADGFR